MMSDGPTEVMRKATPRRVRWPRVRPTRLRPNGVRTARRCTKSASPGPVQQGPHVLAIPGTANSDHLVENIAAHALRLSPTNLAHPRLLSRLRRTRCAEPEVAPGG